MVHENKSQFVKKFCKLIRQNTSEYADVKDITYRMEENGEEYIYVTFESNTQRKICVSADSCRAIMEDFLSKISHAQPVPYEEKIEPSKEEINLFEEMSMTYTPEDFTGYIGVLLDDNADEEQKKESMQFLERLYLLATNYI